MSKTATDLPASLVTEKTKQREKDLLARINMLIKSASESTTIIEQYRRDVLEERKITVDVKLKLSRLKDEIVVLEGKLQTYNDKDRALMLKVSEKVV
jgi:hypothetical protein